MKAEIALAATAAICIAGGCIQVKTESEIKPIHITMDVNLKVDKDLDKAFADEDQQKPKGNYKAVKETDDDRILIADENAKRMKRFRDIAKENGTTLEAVQKRYAAKMREKIPAGAWYQDDAGKWQQKK